MLTAHAQWKKSKTSIWSMQNLYSVVGIQMDTAVKLQKVNKYTFKTNLATCYLASRCKYNSAHVLLVVVTNQTLYNLSKYKSYTVRGETTPRGCGQTSI
jgi:hypothetical protein